MSSELALSLGTIGRIQMRKLETVRCGSGDDVARADPGDRLIGCERRR